MFRSSLKLIILLLTAGLLIAFLASPAAAFNPVVTLPSQAQASSAAGIAIPPPIPLIYQEDGLDYRYSARPQLLSPQTTTNTTFTFHFVPAGSSNSFGDSCLTFPDNAKTVFNAAAQVWSGLLNSTVPITIEACWANLGTGILGHSGTLNFWRDFPNAPQANTWYPQSLADALSGTTMDFEYDDMSIAYANGFSSTFYYGTDGNTPAGKIDFMSVVLHEIAHGLGFSGSMRVSGSTGYWGLGTSYPVRYDDFAIDNLSRSLLNTSIYPNYSSTLASVLTSNGVYFNGTHAVAANGGTAVKLYAPYNWEPGSSYAHLDYNTYLGTPNTLMVYAIGTGSSIHDPGPVGLGVLADVGWPLVPPVTSPTLDSISPSSAAAGAAAFTLTANGSSFISSSVIRWNGVALATTYVSSSKLTASVPSAKISTAGTASVTVFTAAAGGGESSAQTFTTNNVIPTLTSLSPSSITAGNATFILTVNGTNFVIGSMIRWNGIDQPTTLVSSTKLTTSVDATKVSAAGIVPISVANPPPGGGGSASALNFTVNNPSPTLTSLSPSTVTAGGAGFTLMVTGTKFVATSVIRWAGVDLATTYISATQLSASVDAAKIAAGGTASLTVFNPVPAGGTSAAKSITINNPVPILTNLSPSTGPMGSTGLILTANGANFVTTSVIRWNGVSLATTYVSGTQLTASIDAARISALGTASVTVFNPTPVGGTSSAQSFAIVNPLPTLLTLNIYEATAGGAGFMLTAGGTNFVTGAVICWNGVALVTNRVSNTQLTASVDALRIALAGTANVTVINPVPGGGESSALTFTINNPAPTLTSLNPSMTTAGGVSFTLTVTGTNFVSSSVIRWAGDDLSTNYISATQLSASIDPVMIAEGGTASVTIFNPTPAGGTSAPQSFTINNPVPTLLSLSPYEAAPGGPAFTLTVTGMQFMPGAAICWDGVPLLTEHVTSTQLTASIDASQIASMGEVDVTVVNPVPGGGESAARPFHIGKPKPVLISLGPPMVTVGDAGFTLTVTGSNFEADSTIRWNGVDLETTFVSDSELTAVIDSADIAAMGTIHITVNTPGPGGIESDPFLFLIMGVVKVFLPFLLH